MAIMVKDILNIALFRNAEILAGANGLNNEVKRISIADNPSSDVDNALCRAGVFYLSSFYFFRDNTTAMYENLAEMINSDSSCLCLINEYITKIPDEIRNFCDEKNFPIIMIDKYIPYSDIISKVIELIIFDQQNILLENKISTLAGDLVDDFHKSKILSEINPYFQSHLTAIFCIPLCKPGKLNSTLLSKLDQSISTSAINFKNGFLILVSYKESDPSVIQEKIDYVIENITKNYSDYVIGISNYNNRLLNCGNAINQAMAAADSRSIKNTNIIYYTDLGIIKLLLLFNAHEELNDFYNDIIGPIEEFDRINKDSKLLETIIRFIDNSRDYKSTASALFLHENTVRYRVTKVKDLVATKNSNKDLLEDISIAIKIYKLRKAMNQ